MLYLSEHIIELGEVSFGFAEEVFVTQVHVSHELFFALDDVFEALVLDLLEVLEGGLSPVGATELSL